MIHEWNAGRGSSSISSTTFSNKVTRLPSPVQCGEKRDLHQGHTSTHTSTHKYSQRMIPSKGDWKGKEKGHMGEEKGWRMDEGG
jgi:hypothetical protein